MVRRDSVVGTLQYPALRRIVWAMCCRESSLCLAVFLMRPIKSDFTKESPRHKAG
jgi:hypothetical protein